jgi:exopolysaccharide biosynthesis protein
MKWGPSVKQHPKVEKPSGRAAPPNSGQSQVTSSPGNQRLPVDKQTLPVGRRRLPVVWLIAGDVLIGALILLAYSLYSFILPRDLSGQSTQLPTQATTTVSTTGATTAPGETSQTSNPSATTSETRATGPWAAKFPGRFTDGVIEQTASTYRSANISLSIEKVEKNGATYYVADIYLADLKFFKTAFATGKYGRGLHEATDVMARENKAILAINGDYCGNNAGPVVRNGVLYRDEPYKDVLVMYNDGSMATFTADTFNMAQIKATGAYQVWTFGPMLLDGGQVMTQFNSTVTSLNPRTAIGYYEPGHYCFVLVDGRQPGYSNGLSLKQMSELFFDLGCTAAFNLDGGQSSEMAYLGQLYNIPYNGGRPVSDCVMIVDEAADAAVTPAAGETTTGQ